MDPFRSMFKLLKRAGLSENRTYWIFGWTRAIRRERKLVHRVKARVRSHLLIRSLHSHTIEHSTLDRYRLSDFPAHRIFVRRSLQCRANSSLRQFTFVIDSGRLIADFFHYAEFEIEIYGACKKIPTWAVFVAASFSLDCETRTRNAIILLKL